VQIAGQCVRTRLGGRLRRDQGAGGKFTTNDTAEGAGSIFVPIETDFRRT
jgi:hypothetical protein